jgi:putative phosphoribosyl transferase
VEGDRPIVVVNEQMPAEYAAYVEREAARQIEEIARRRTLYRGGRPLVRVAGRAAIVVDDGVATGATFRAALEAVRRMKAAKIIAAIPVAPADSLALIAALSDEVECLATPENFHAVGMHYERFDQTSDEEVVRLLAPFR